jgi:hypothetical protein
MVVGQQKLKGLEFQTNLSRHNALITGMIVATPPCPIMIYCTKIAGRLVVDLFCLLEAGSEIIEYRSW